MCLYWLLPMDIVWPGGVVFGLSACPAWVFRDCFVYLFEGRAEYCFKWGVEGKVGVACGLGGGGRLAPEVLFDI